MTHSDSLDGTIRETLAEVLAQAPPAPSFDELSETQPHRSKRPRLKTGAVAVAAAAALVVMIALATGRDDTRVDTASQPSTSGEFGDADDRRETFEIISYRFDGTDVVVEAQQPGDPGCYEAPKLDVRLGESGLRLSVSYVRTTQEACITPCPLSPLTLREALPAGSSGRQVVLDDPPTHRACAGVSGGPSTVP